MFFASKSRWHQEKKQPLSQTRARMIFGAFFLFFFAMVFRLIDLQIMEHDWYRVLASGQHELFEELVPERGEIFMHDQKDQNNVLVATNQTFPFLYADPRLIKDPLFTAKTIGDILGYEDDAIDRLYERLSQTDDPYEPIAHKITHEQYKAIHEKELSGIFFIPESFRFYPEAQMSGHLVGFVGSDEEGNYAGRYGVEGYFDDVLSGTAGFLRSDRDLSGSFITVGYRSMQKATDGADIFLTIDRNIQFVACQKLQEAVTRHGAERGSVIIVDPNTGAILASCAVPDFDPNHYERVSSITVFNNPVIFSAYEPGSIFKPITMAAALDQGAVTPETLFDDTGSVVINNITIRNSENKTYRIQTMTQVLEESINTGIIFAMQAIGPERFADYVRSFGFGALTGIELKTEMPGNISSLEKTAEIYAATASFGQGITTTPLQLVMAYAAIANGGNLLKPQIVSEIYYPDGSKKQRLREEIRPVMSEKTAGLLGAMLVSVVEHGHGKRAGVPGYYIAGKTGTAQVAKVGEIGYDSHKTIGSFAGFGPVSQPRFAMVVRIDDPKDVRFAESTAAPLFGEIANFLLNYLEVPPEREIN